MNDDTKPDPHRIHELEYELGFRNDPPRTKGFDRLEITDKPGAVIDYDPRLLKTSAGRIALVQEIAERHKS